MPRDGADAEYDVRYWTPEVGVPFCGHGWGRQGPGGQQDDIPRTSYLCVRALCG